MSHSIPPSKDIFLEYAINGMNFQSAGEASSNIKHTLQLVGFKPEVIRRVAIAAYEAEMNIVIHAIEGMIRARISSAQIEITAEDVGPGIPDTDLAMREGYSTAPDKILEMGFGAGMGLPNIKRCSDEFFLESTIGTGTKVKAVIHNR